MKRLLPVVATILLAISSTVAISIDKALELRRIDTSRYPSVKLTAMLSGAGDVGALDKQAFSLKENGETVRRFEVNDISKASAPVGVVLVVDTSGSMSGDPITNAKQAAKVFIGSKRARDQIAVVGFGSTVQKVAGFTDDGGVLEAAVDKLEASGETKLYDGVSLAVELFKGSRLAQKNIIVLSDGKDTKSSATEQSVIEAATRAAANVFSIGLASPDFDVGSLKSIAGATGGKYLEAPNAEALTGLYVQLARELHNQYEVSYISNAKSEKVDLALNIDGASIKASASGRFNNPDYKPVTGSSDIVVEKSLKLASSNLLVLFVALTGVFVAVTLFALNILGVLFPAQSVLKKQIDFYEQVFNKNHKEAHKAGAKGAEFYERLLKATGTIAERRGFTELIQHMLANAGVRLKANEFIFLHVLGVLVLSIGSYMATGSAIVGLLFALLGTVLPLLYLQLLVQRMREKLDRQLPDTLTTLAGSMRAGYSFLQAVSTLVEEALPPIGAEFKKVLVEARLGLPLEKALQNMADRVGSTDLKWTVMAVNIQREVGGNLAELFDILAHTMRERERVRRQIRTLTAEGRLSATILYVLPFAIGALLTVINPGYIGALFSSTLGITMMAVAVVLMIIGAFWLKQTVTVEV